MVQQHQENQILQLKLAKKINGEIINADSMQVYKDLKILTARPLKKNKKN
jgi:tRNA dimethylallyltransferase